MNEFFTWQGLGTYTGATVFTALVTQMTKGIPLIDRIPTRLWCYIVALVTLTAATLVTLGWDISAMALNAANAVVVSLAAQGGYTVATQGLKKKE